MDKLSQSLYIKAAKLFGTPLYFYDAKKIINNFQMLRQKIPPEISIYYSLKANPTLAIAQLLAYEGAGCEVCSIGELEVAIRAGFHPKKIIFVGPGKKKSDLATCVEHNINMVICESIDEIRTLNDVAKAAQKKCSFMIRINPSFKINAAALKMGGIPTQFGIDSACLEQNMQTILNYENLSFKGIHIYNGTQILDETAIANNINEILQYSSHISQKHNLIINCIDLGGGFGVPYFHPEEKLNINKLSQMIKISINDYLQKHPQTQFIIETGRFLTAEAGILIGCIITTKKSRDQNFIITDIGAHCHLAATQAGLITRRHFPIALLAEDDLNTRGKNAYTIAGPLCTPGDILGREIILPKPLNGEYIAVKNSGAYGLTYSPGKFLSHETPAEILYYKGELSLIRRRETVDDLLRTQIPINMEYKDVINV